MISLKNKVAVVTGGSKGIGKAIAVALGREGCRIAISARDESELNKTADDLSRRDIEVLSVKTDIRKLQDVQKFVSQVEDKFGPAEILVNNAGIGRFGEVLNFSEEDFRDTLETNLFGVFYCTRGFLPGMISKKEGHIVNISSLAGKNNFAGGSAYCASKHGLISFAECVMLEVRQHNIKVTTICPGSVQTEFSAGSMEKNWALKPEDVAKAVVDVVTSSAGALASLVELRPLKPPKK